MKYKRKRVSVKDTRALKKERSDKTVPIAHGAQCYNCPLKDSPLVPNEGESNAPFVICGDRPHSAKITDWKPIAGTDRELLDSVLVQNNLNANDFLLTNLVMCTSRSYKDFINAVPFCVMRLQNDIKDKYVISLGETATKNLMVVDDDMAYSKLRGQWYKSLRYDVLPTQSFKYALNTNPDSLRDITKDFRRVKNPNNQVAPVDYTVIDNHDQLQFLVDWYLDRPNDLLVVDLETCNEDMIHSDPDKWWEGYILCLGLTMDKGDAYVIPEDMMQQPDTLEILKPLLERKKGIVGANFKFDMVYLHKYYDYTLNIRLDEDTYMMSYILDERSSGHSLKDHAKMFDDGYYDDVLLTYLGKTKKARRNTAYAKIPRKELYLYVSKDVDYTLRTCEIFTKELKELHLYDWPYKNVLIRAQELFVQVELFGVYTHKDKIQEAIDTVLPKVNSLRSELQKLTGISTFNPNSPQQVSKFLYGELKLPMPPGKHKVGCTDKTVVAKITAKIRDDYLTGVDDTGKVIYDPEMYDSTKYLFVTKLTQYRTWSKLWSSYVNKLSTLIDKHSFSHYGFNLARTVTGRLAGSILMTLPGNEIGGPLVRGCFGAPDNINDMPPHYFKIVHDYIQKIMRPIDKIKSVKVTKIIDGEEVKVDEPLKDFVLIDADYSQAEVRTAGYLSNDEAIHDVYANDKDIHGEVSLEAFGPNWTKDHRRIAKNVVFGSMYGATVETLVEAGVPRKVAEMVFARFEAWAWGYNKWRIAQFDLAKSRGYLQTPTGRMRRFPIITPKKEWHMRNQAYNFPVQSLANDVALLAFCEITDTLRELKLPVWPTIFLHDGLYFICLNDKELIAQVKKLVLDKMESVAHTIQTLNVFEEFKTLEPIKFKADFELKRYWS